MEILTLIDGTELEGTILPSGDGLSIFVYLTGKTILEGANIFSDKNRVSIIKATNHGTETVYKGYTEITAINNEFGNCNLVMRKEINNA